MVVRDRVAYHPKQPLWAQMPKIAGFSSEQQPNTMSALQQAALTVNSNLLVVADNVQAAQLPPGVTMHKTSERLQLIVGPKVKRLDICHINSGLDIELNFTENADCLVVSNVYSGAVAQNITANWQLATNAKVQHILNLHADQGNFSWHQTVAQASSSSFQAWRLVHSGAWCHEHTHCLLQGEGASSEIKALVLAFNGNNCQSGARFEHIAPRTDSNHQVNMLVAEQARAVCFSDVEVAVNAHDVSSEQYNKNLALAASAEIFTQPRLCINNDKVVCSHGATTGELEPAQLRYLCARGLSLAQAKKLLIMGYAQTILQDLPVDNWSATVLKKLGDFCAI